MTDPRDQLQASLGQTYVIERELGGGGMSRVFLADDAEAALPLLGFAPLDSLDAAARESAEAALPCDPVFDRLKANPRFDVLMQRIGARTCPPSVNWPIRQPGSPPRAQ